jgi:SAM-dependent methyltransferase
MSEQPPALSFGGVADAYDRARPSYPDDASRWLVGTNPKTVLELGAGTGKLTASLQALGHRVVATDALAPMLAHLRSRVPGALPVQAVAEQIPLPARSVDVVVSAQAYHWFDLGRALPEIARVLRPGGTIALVWNEPDERIPWVRRLEQIIGTQHADVDPTQSLLGSHLFGYVEQERFRVWQDLDRERLRDLAASRSSIATLDDAERERALQRVDSLYDEYGRGADGMRLPYLTRCWRAVVRPQSVEEPVTERRDDPGDDTDSLLIDFQ